MIPVTRPFLPPIEEYNEYLNGIWQRNWLTNMGPLANELELELKEFLGLKNCLFVTNGTVAIQIAIKALELKGDIITTPFSFVATSSSIVWENCNPVFVDIDPDSLNIDATKIEEAITDTTCAILATHVYGNPCDVFRIEKIAKKYNLKVIYDGAHSFGVKVDGKSIFNFGDISTCSFHATKLYHSIEGGIIVTNSMELSRKMAYMRNFGFSGPETFSEVGINGKNSEFHAAMGLLNLKYIDKIFKKRRAAFEYYNYKLESLNIDRPKWHELSENNYAYYPLIFQTEQQLLSVINKLVINEVFGRRYFYPPLSQSLPYVDKSYLPVTESISKRVFCLPFYYDLSNEEIDLVCKLISDVLE